MGEHLSLGLDDNSFGETEKRQARQDLEDETPENIDFLGNASTTLFNLIPDQDGYVNLSRLTHNLIGTQLRVDKQYRYTKTQRTTTQHTTTVQGVVNHKDAPHHTTPYHTIPHHTTLICYLFALSR